MLVALLGAAAALRLRGDGCTGGACGPFPWSAPEPPGACAKAEEGSSSFCADASTECACRREESEAHVKELCKDFGGQYDGCVEKIVVRLDELEKCIAAAHEANEAEKKKRYEALEKLTGQDLFNFVDGGIGPYQSACDDSCASEADLCEY